MPGSSAFARQGGSAAAPCSYSFDQVTRTSTSEMIDGRLQTSTLETTERITRTDGDWHFREIPVFDAPHIWSVIDSRVFGHLFDGMARSLVNLYRPLEDGDRRFDVYCSGDYQPVAGGATTTGYNFFVRTIDVAALDSFLDPRDEGANLRDQLDLVTPTVWQNPVVDEWGGLVVAHPVWLAIHDDAWQVQHTERRNWRGWDLRLDAIPAQLGFTVEHRPSEPERSASVVAVDCPSPTPGGGIVPGRPNDLPDFQEPGTTGPCRWSPPSRGTATITATVTYDVVFTATHGGEVYVEPQAPYTWSSPPVTLTVGELRNVNVNDPD